MCLSRPSLALPQFGDFGRVERILELHVDPRAGQDAPRVVLAPEGTGGLGRGGGEKRAGQPPAAAHAPGRHVVGVVEAEGAS